MAEGQSNALHRAYDLYHIGRAIIDGDRFDVWNRILEHIVHEFDAVSATVALVDTPAGELTIIGGIGHRIDLVGKTIKLGEGVMGWVASKGRPVLLNEDPSADRRFDNVAQRQHKPHSAICWPLRVEQRVIGVLSVNRSDRAPRYTQADLEQSSTMIDVVSLVIDNASLHVERERRMELLNREKAAQEELVAKLRKAQDQILRCDRMASIGHLAAGVAHEINNPIGYVTSNVITLDQYVKDLLRLLHEYEGLERCSEAGVHRVAELRKQIDVGTIKADAQDLVDETREGLTRVKGIVQDLKMFCHVSNENWEWVDLHDGINSTLNIVGHETKYKAEIVRDYGTLPPVECVSSQLNQVFMNLLINAAQSIDDRGTITICTRAHADSWISVEVSDTGAGIAPETVERIFEPLFTTKQRGEGSGLGLSVCAGIVNKHGGRIEVRSALGQGSAFAVWLPISRVNSGAIEARDEPDATMLETSGGKVGPSQP